MEAAEDLSGSEVRLACLLLAYEVDEPHVNFPDGVQGEQYYPEITPESFITWLLSEHHGDCTKVPSPCIRCLAETVAHKAKWIKRRL